MRIFENLWAYLLCASDSTTQAPWGGNQLSKQLSNGPSALQIPSNGPVFTPPYPPSDPPAPGHAIQCDYSGMRDWEECNSAEDRQCWLRGPRGEVFNIHTDYETKWPKGVTRKYVVDVSEMALSPDGVCMPHGKVFNGSYPGPWIQACWGDDLEITVRNNLRFNGTTIHWHGIRQLNTVEMDGVNGITQCPIPPGDEFTYRFKAMQYGSSWYHSHYSLQYADGLVGPMTVYGPSSADYDEAIEPILMTDWNHRSAFEDWSWSLQPNHTRPLMTNILLNGIGQYKDPNKRVAKTELYSKSVRKGVRYLLRLINTSVDTTFVFAIDGHNVTVIGSDFVPIKPYNTSSVLVGIGQRYHVIFEANPINQSADGNYWIRTIPANGCGMGNFQPGNPPDNTTGIIRYDMGSLATPTTIQSTFPVDCSDEPYDSLVPIFPWQVGDYSNTEARSHSYDVGLDYVSGNPYHPNNTRQLWDIAEVPLWLNFSNPTILNLDTASGGWAKELDIVTQEHNPGSWVYLVITAPPTTDQNRSRFFIPLAHPIHLHGHDFALLAQSNKTYPGSLDAIKDSLKLSNPPRRDVALLPQGGYLVIAFKTDNPGVWLMHCHIAWHASSGLGLQILENKDQIKIGSQHLEEMDRTCERWDAWVGDERNHWDNKNKDAFQDDSGI